MMTFEEWWEDRRPLSESISMKDMARFAWNAGTKCAPPEGAMPSWQTCTRCGAAILNEHPEAREPQQQRIPSEGK